jgi:uncharacterized protein (DUF849 family)
MYAHAPRNHHCGGADRQLGPRELQPHYTGGYRPGRGGMRYDPTLLAYLKSRLPSGSSWGAILIHSRDFSDHVEAARAGATVLRVGFEDSLDYNGSTATSNAELVTALRAELEVAGFSIASAPEARALLLG